jgi:flagellar motor switch protein FliM
MGLVRDLGEVRPYDFQRPHQLSRLQLDAITLITESYLRVASNFLSSYLRTPVQIQHLATDQMPYERYADNVKTPTVLCVYTLNPYPGSALVECDPVLALAIIDRALGGPGLGKYPGRELTEIEQTIFRRVMDRLLELMRQSWGAMVSFEPRVEGVEYSPAFAQIAGENDLVMVLRQQMAIDGHRGHLIWVWPYASIQPFAVAVTRHGWGRDDGTEMVHPKQKEMMRHVARVSISARVILGRTEITLGEFSQLKVGDAIVFKNRYDQPMTLSLSNADKFQCVAGKTGGHLAVRVVGKLEGDVDG